MYDVALLGNAAVDALVNTTDEILAKHDLKKGDFHVKDFAGFMALNEDCRVEKFESGGSIANTAFALGKLGRKVAFLSRFGEDPSGRHFKMEMEQAGVHMPQGENGIQTMEIYVLITPDGQRTFVSPGVTAPMAPQHMDEEIIKNSKWLMIEGYTLLDQKEAVDTAVELARKHNVKIGLTLASFAVLEQCSAHIADEIAKGLDLIVANDEEMAALLAAVEKNSRDGKEELVRKVEATPRVITQSGDGATFTSGAEKTTVPTTKVDTPVDTTGAGDAFAAGFLSHYVLGSDVETGMKLGHKLAGSVIMRTGARIQEGWEEIAAA